MVLEHGETAGSHGNGLQQSGVERERQMEKGVLDWIISGSDYKKKEGKCIDVGCQWELKSRRVCVKSQSWRRMERTDQASERDTNQHLLIASGVPRERSICRRGRRTEEQKEKGSRRSLKIAKECHIFCLFSASLQATHESKWMLFFSPRTCLSAHQSVILSDPHMGASGSRMFHFKHQHQVCYPSAWKLRPCDVRLKYRTRQAATTWM